MATPLPPEVTAEAERDQAVVVVDQQGRIVLMNAQAEKLFDVALSDVEGEFVELLVPEKLRWGHQAYRRGYLAEPNPREMDPGLDPHLERPTDGTLIPISVWLQPIRVDGTLYVAARVTPRGEPAAGS
jgi:PAS domain S-box-containing protein